ncbi:MAG: hypothetical protein ACRENE_29540, partial [Polyangiaceae bacterium]
MATKVDHLIEEALALSADERARVAAKLLASLPAKPATAAPRRLLDLAGRGVGVWGEDSTATAATARRMALTGPLAGARLAGSSTMAANAEVRRPSFST